MFPGRSAIPDSAPAGQTPKVELGIGDDRVRPLAMDRKTFVWETT
jgi:hypothetical protein